MDKEKEKKAFYELKNRMEGDMESYLFEDDNIFYRFLRARDLDVDLAEAMLRKHLEWRKQHDVKNVLKFKSPEVLEMYLPSNFLGYTKEGEVLRYRPTGNVDIKGVLACCSNEDVTKHLIKCYEEDLAAAKKQSERLGKLVDKCVYIQNLKGLTLGKFLDKKVIRHFITICNMHQDNYPETLKMAIAINAPPFVGFIYELLKSFLPSTIIQKVKIYTDDSFKNDLLEIADAEMLPAFLGGKKTDPDGNPLCNTFISHAGMVPERYYIKKSQSFTSLEDIQNITVPRAAVHEVPREVKEAGMFLEWEFKVKSGDIKFGVRYQNDKGNETEIFPLQTITADENGKTGSHKCENVGTYIIVFDNTYSFLRSKDIFCKIQLISGEKEVRCVED